MTRFLAQYGLLAHVGQFHSARADYARGEQVLLRTPRGAERGTILCPAPDSKSDDDGEILAEAITEANDVFQREMLDTMASDLASHPVTLLDLEILHNRSAAILHILAHDTCELDEQIAAWSERFGLPVRLLDMSVVRGPKDPAPKGCSSCGSDKGGCSTGGCGTEKGGCSTGSCSKGSVKSAGELTNYFAGLREKMEAEVRHRHPLH
ncbi:MAG: hypothetical protein ACRC8S_18120 [Fimbriiglobus sp.]